MLFFAIHFFYAKEEKAYKSCIKYVKRAYPKVKCKVVSGYGHMTFSVKRTEECVEMLRKIYKKEILESIFR